LTDNSICDVPGFKVGHFCKESAKTGCTVILPDVEATAGVDIRGSAPGTREIELLKPVRLVQKIHAVLLTGGSAFGLNAAGGVQNFLEDRGIGFKTDDAVIPIVPAAVIYDLGVGDSKVRPDAVMGYKACQAANSNCERGNVGVGCGATVGKVLGMERASKGGVGTCSQKVGDDIWIGVLTVVNCFGEVINPDDNEIAAGVLNKAGNGFVPTLEIMAELSKGSPFGFTNTTLSGVATNASLNREQATKMAQMAQNGLAKTIRPAHTMYDGDIVFALSAGDKLADINLLGSLACDLVAESIIQAVAH
jgi:L-aminopeptidase/D-esterase-like protein